MQEQIYFLIQETVNLPNNAFRYNFDVFFFFFVAVFLGCTSTGRVGLCFFFLWIYVQEHTKAQPAVVLVLKRLRRRGNGLKSHPTRWIF